MPIATMRRPQSDTGTTFASTILAARPALHRYALRMTKDHAAAEDLVQETLGRAWSARDRFDNGGNIKAWLFRIARNAFLSGLRRSRRQVAWDPDRHHLMLVQGATQDEALYARDLDAALSRLPASQRSALLLVADDGLSMADAADELGVPMGTVKSRVARARASMRHYVVGDLAQSRNAASSGSPVAKQGSAPVFDTDDDTDAIPLSRYQRWKASGSTTIG